MRFGLFFSVFGLSWFLLAITIATVSATETVLNRQEMAALVEADWLQQAESWRSNPSGLFGPAHGPVTTADDAAGAVDGIKKGLYAFHCGFEPNPWWSVDLRENVPIGRIVVYNRLDYEPGLHNADNLKILISADSEHWEEVYAHPNTFFGGISREKPLEVCFDPPISAQFVRLMIPSETPIFLHLDEVEVYGVDDPKLNIALGCPANQSSLSPWSVKKQPVLDKPGEHEFPTHAVLERGKKLATFLGQDDARARLEQFEHDVLSLLQSDPMNVESAKHLYLKVRWAIRDIAFSNPLLDFDRLLFVKRFTQQTYPDICLNHMPWISRPGGDICILEHPFATRSPSTKGADSRGGEKAGNTVINPVVSQNGNGLDETLRGRKGGNEDQAVPQLQSLHELIRGQLGPGHVHGMDLHWDGQKVVFGFAKQPDFPWTGSDWPPPFCGERTIGHELRGSQEPTHIYTVNLDGTGLRQLTHESYWSDLDPTWLPNDDIAFVSDRCGYSLQCNHDPNLHETSCNLYVMKDDGSKVRRLSVNKDGDYLPHTLDDGTIGYTRWEYQERNLTQIQSLWYVRPDGTGADVLFKQHLDNPWALEDVRSVPTEQQGERKYVAIAAGHHTLACGPVVLISPHVGLNNPDGITIVTPGTFPPEGGMSGTPVLEGGVPDDGGHYMNPWALSEKFFLVAYSYDKTWPQGLPEYFRGADEKGYALYLIDVLGNKELIYKDPDISCSVPIPLTARKRPPVLFDSTDETLDYAVCTLNRASFGMTDVQPEEIKYLRISQGLPWPYSEETGGMRYELVALSMGLSWTPTRVLGTVPIHPDGSASFKVPVDEAVYFQLLDENFQEIRRMRSFISFQPGEKRGCVGCHETTTVVPPAEEKHSLALLAEPVQPTPPSWGGHRAISFLRDIQPVFDRNCISCHSGLTPSAGLDFSGGLVEGATIATSVGTLGFDGHNRAYRTILENQLVSIANKYDAASVLSTPRMFGSSQSRLIRAIQEGPCPIAKTPIPPDDYLSLVTWIDANAPYHDRFLNMKSAKRAYDLPAEQELQKTIQRVHERRCGNCHDPGTVSRLDWIDLQHPENSRFLKAPLTGRCGKVIYANEADSDYQILLQTVEEAVQRAKHSPRRDVTAIF
ncbi:MAG: discoidin domain-containing protein [Thermoguttaceae bacterium]